MFRRPLLSLHHSHLHTRASARRHSRARVHVLARSLVHFRYLPYGTLGEAEREGFVRVQLEAWSPFASTAHAVALGARGAMLFAWDAATWRERCQQAGIDPAAEADAAFVPETLLLPRQDEGVRLQTCVEGFEGQVWRGGELLASRWWPEPPAEVPWLNFLRGAGVLVDSGQAAVPAAAPAEHAESGPWADAQTQAQLGAQRQLRSSAIVGLALLTLLLPTLWLLRSAWHEHEALAQVTDRREQAAARAAPVTQARAESLRLLASVERYQALVARPDMLALLAHLAGQLPADGTQLRQLDWDGKNLRLALAVPPGASRVDHVRALEDGGWLRDVREESQDSAAGVVTLVAAVGSRPASAAASAAGVTTGSRP